MQLFYCPEAAGAALCTLDADESRHAVRVLRMRAGDPITLTDGLGTFYDGRIVGPDEHACTVEVVDARHDQRATGPRLRLAVAPTKNPARMEWLVEKAVEVGVGEVVLLGCDHSERSFLKTDRLAKIALSAMKQSLHSRLPLITGTVPFGQWMAEVGRNGVGADAQPVHEQLLIAHCDAEQERQPLANALASGIDTTVLIGPEGDFSAAEVQSALGCGFRPVSLGPSRLRTETAAIYAAVAFNLANDHGEE